MANTEVRLKDGHRVIFYFMNGPKAVVYGDVRGKSTELGDLENPPNSSSGDLDKERFRFIQRKLEPGLTVRLGSTPYQFNIVSADGSTASNAHRGRFVSLLDRLRARLFG